MKTRIQTKLAELEKEHSITMLLACETGSRAWGFASPDSDYDVRFIYAHQPDWYLSIYDQKDTLEWLEGDLNLVGWDIRKCLQLLNKSNASVFERLQSPIIYREVEGFRQEFLAFAPDYFSPKAGLHHYLSMAKKYFELCTNTDEVKLKALFYLLRTALASLWIIEKESVPPLAFAELRALVTNEIVNRRIDELLAIKAEVTEKYTHHREPALEQYVAEIINYCTEKANELGISRGHTDSLNDFFRKWVNA